MDHNTSQTQEQKQQSIIIQEYIQTLNEKELYAIEIAKDHLESSFDIEKSVGFLEFKKSYK
jgi:hypothetical protein